MPTVFNYTCLVLKKLKRFHASYKYYQQGIKHFTKFKLHKMIQNNQKITREGEDIGL